MFHFLIFDPYNTELIRRLFPGNAETTVLWFKQIDQLEATMRNLSGPIVTIISASACEDKLLLAHACEVVRFDNSQFETRVLSLVLCTGLAPGSLVYELNRHEVEVLILGPQEGAIWTMIDLLKFKLTQKEWLMPLFEIADEGAGAEPSVSLIGRVDRPQFRAGGRGVDLLETLSPRWQTRRQLSVHSGIPVNMIGAYRKRLIDEYDLQKLEAGLIADGSRVFQIEKSGGVWWYRLMALIKRV